MNTYIYMYIYIIIQIYKAFDISMRFYQEVEEAAQRRRKQSQNSTRLFGKEKKYV